VVEKMRLLVQASVAGAASDEELERCLAQHRDAFRQPELISFRHVFFSSARRGEEPARAKAAEVSAVAAGSGEGMAGVGDAFLLGHEYRRRSRRDLEKIFGPEFCAAVFALSPGGWSTPIRSAQGFHLVYVEERLPERDPPLGEVRSRVVHLHQDERRRERLREFVDGLRRAATVRIEAQG
jgi:hypothetical protein